MISAKPARRALRPSFLLFAATMLLPTRAAATVYEIADDGKVRIGRSGTFESIGTSAGEPASTTDAAPDVPPEAITTPGPTDVPTGFREALLAAAGKYGLSPRLVAALARQESAWRASATSAKGALGLTQLMPATARALAVDPRDPSANLDGGARYLRMLLDQFDGDLERALAAYNAGPRRVERAGGVPRIGETRTYVATIVDRLGLAASQGGR